MLVYSSPFRGQNDQDLLTHSRATDFVEFPPNRPRPDEDQTDTDGLAPPPTRIESGLANLIGTMVSRYQVVDKLGGGGMGQVYRAEDSQLERTVALKFLAPDLCANPTAVARFVSEARAASGLDHPNICTIYEIGDTEQGHPYIAMAYYEGETLDRKIRKGSLALEQALDYATQMARGLAQAHARGIVHRDIKPANVIVTPEGIVKLLDFGLAKVADLEMTRPGTVMGTCAYMSPEQARGRPVDARTDIWAWGAVLYELVTGQRAFHAENSQAILYRVVHEQPELLQGAMVDPMPPAIQQVLLRCLEKEQDLRYPSITEALVDLEALVGESPLPTVFNRPPNLSWSGISSASAWEGITIVVLPFLDMSPDKDQEYFSDGMAEELSDSLAQIDRWRVVARTSAFSFKGKDLDVRQIGRRVGATHLLEGSIRKSGNVLRVRAELVDVQTGLLLWSGKYHREMDDLFTIQEDIAQSIVANLEIELHPSEEARLIPRHTADLEAYNLYLKARYHFNKRTEAGLVKGREFCEQALGRDPGYAPAHACLADCLLLLGFQGVAAPTEVMPAAKAAAERALELDETLAEAHTSLGCVRSVYEWDWVGAEAAFDAALKLNQNYATAHHWYAVWYLLPTGQFDKAKRALRTALALDPVSLILNAVLGWHHYFARRYDDAIRALQNTLEIDDRFVVAHDLLGQAFLQQGLLAESIGELERAVELSGGRTLSLSSLGHACAVAGEKERARELLEELACRAQTGYVSSYDRALIHVGLGEHDRALDLLEQASREHSGWLGFLNIEPRLDPVRGEPRFEKLRQRIGLVSAISP